MDAAHPGGLGGTYTGNPLACAAALAAIDEIEQPTFLARADEIAERVRAYLEKIQAQHPDLVGDVRGLGSMLAIELVNNPRSREPALDETVAVTTEIR